MLVVGFDIIADLIEREKRDRPQLGRTLERGIAAWKQEVDNAQWAKPTEVKAVYGTADVVGNNRIVFDIGGNNYRLVVQFNYAAGVARVRFAGTHQESGYEPCCSPSGHPPITRLRSPGSTS